MSGKGRRLWSRSGQSIVEYLVVIGVILGVLVGLSTILKTKTEQLGTKAGEGIGKSTQVIKDEVKSTEQ